MKKCIVCLLMILLSGCVATGPSFTKIIELEDDGSAIYLYRPSTIVNSGMAPDVYINGVKYSKLNDGGYQVYNLEPGSYQVVIDGNLLTWFHGRSEVNVNLLERQTVYIRLGDHVGDVSGFGFAVTGAIFTEVDESLAKKELMDTKLSM
ncbi:DUF2846 domain-containing protein [Photobacterium satsumensis]|uniref:DUF2846 domain-containing protein n=1 Tax=Photobacterium satsumensis TaxID=2910239 RepID=UPI003D13A6FC